MNHLFVSNQIAKQLKEKGFDEPCLAYYSGSDLEDKTLYTHTTFSIGSSIHRNGIEGFDKSYTFSAPLYQQAIDWLREKHKLFIILNCTNTKYPNGNWECEVSRNNDREYGHFGFETHHEALNKAIDEALKLI